MIRESINVVNSAISRIKKIYRIIARTPTNDEEEENNTRLAYKLLHNTYLFWSEYHIVRRLSIWQKFAFYMLVTLFSIIGYLYYGIILLKEHVIFDIGECFAVGSSLCVNLFVFVVIPIYLKFFGNMILETLDYTKTFKSSFNAINFSSAEPIISDRLNKNCCINTGNIYKKENIVSIPILVSMVGMLAGIFSVILPPLNYILKYGGSFPTIQDYYILFPLYNRIESPIIYWVVTILITIFGSYAMFIAFSGSILLHTLPRLMKYNALVVSEKIHLLSLNFIFEYDKMQRTKEEEYNWESTKNRLFTAFDKDLVQLLKQYQKFSKYTNMTETFMNYVLTWMICVGPIAMFSVVAQMIMLKADIFQQLRNIFNLIYLMLITFFICSLAKTFEDVGEIYQYAVYNMPWYYLPPKTRKLINIFQCMVRGHPEFKVLRVYPVNMSLFPRLWNSVYSYANILRTTTKH